MNATATVQVCEKVDSRNDPEFDSQFDAEINRVICELREQPNDIAAQSPQRNSQIENQRENKARRWMWGFLFALGAVQLYFVQEMLAALFLFSLAFVALAAIALVLYAASRASEAGAGWIEPYARVAVRVGRRTFGYIGEISKKPFRRPHSETAQ